MRQLSCKRLLIILLSVLALSLNAQSQDSTKSVVTSPPKAKAPATVQKTTKPQAKATVPQPVNQKQAPTTGTVKPDSIKISKPLDNSLNGQYQDLIQRSWAQKGYRVVLPVKLNNLWKSVNDTLAGYKKQLSDAKQQLAAANKELEQLKSQSVSPKAAQQPLSSNEIMILGMAVDAGIYNWIVWGIILALSLALAVVLFTTTKSAVDSKHHKQLYEEISAEYQTYKNKAKEKELKLARELQTERNTIEDLLAKREEELNKKK